MIEDATIGLKVTENEDETIWNSVLDARRASIKNLEKSLKIEKVFLKCAEDELAKVKAVMADASASPQ